MVSVGCEGLPEFTSFPAPAGEYQVFKIRLV
uniref:Uncharacterized protein n=1 Tax=Anguilla anguilla TaxID=7936 RepID=A0A0E9UEB6_ANGAN